MTVLEAIQLSSDFLQKKGIVSPRLNAELLLSEILSVKRLDLYLKFDRPLSNDEVNKYRDFLVRRGKSEPLQYIIGHV
ncbi:MAG: peptide chain release factor N(5)-glutamine methyltransferase, partial [Ignavibacteriales bacterium CG_4_9_14_3_um_filter_34_10]